MVKCPPRALGARLMVGQRTLDPYVGVRILRPQPNRLKKWGGIFIRLCLIGPFRVYTGIVFSGLFVPAGAHPAPDVKLRDIGFDI